MSVLSNMIQIELFRVLLHSERAVPLDNELERTHTHRTRGNAPRLEKRTPTKANRIDQRCMPTVRVRNVPCKRC